MYLFRLIGLVAFATSPFFLHSDHQSINYVIYLGSYNIPSIFMNNMTKPSKNISPAISVTFFLLLSFWIIHIIKFITGITFLNFGILPRTLPGLVGIISSPFIHGNFDHLIANSIPFVILNFLLFAFYKDKAIYYLIIIWLSTGLLTWLIGRNANHIGASGVIYGLFTFLVFGGFISRNWRLIIPSILVALLYSSFIWGIFPTEEQVSWEGHLAGACCGCLIAYYHRNYLRIH